MKKKVIKKAIEKEVGNFPLSKKSTMMIMGATMAAVPMAMSAPDLAEAAGLAVNSATPEQMVNKLLGEGVTVVDGSIKWTGAEGAKGIFSGGTGIIGFEEGAILSTGLASSVVGPNNSDAKSMENGTSGDSDLTALGGETNDAAVFEFDIIPQADVISFQYVLSSEEYEEYINYADVFALYINGVNKALVSETNEIVSIGTINHTKNTNLYISNKDNHLNTQMDGLTVVLSCEANVTKGEKTHIKLAIADFTDSSLDSNVFLKAGSIKAGAAQPGVLSLGEITDNTVEVLRDGSDGTVTVEWKATDSKGTTLEIGKLTFNDGVISQSFTFPEGTDTVTIYNPTNGATLSATLQSKKVVDTEPPAKATFTASTTEPTKGPVDITINFPVDGEVREYKIGESGTWITYITPVSITSNNTIYARSKDKAGNVSEEASYEVNNIDITPPAVATFTASPTTPTNGVVEVTINFPTDGAVKEYKIGESGTWTTYTSSVSIKTNNTIYARSQDAAGNMSEEGTYAVKNIDKEAPVMDLATLTTANGSNFVKVGDTVTLTFESSEEITPQKVQINGKVVTPVKGIDGRHWIVVYTMTEEDVEGDVTFQIDYKDLAGNDGTSVTEATDGKTITFDKTAPSLELSKSSSSATNGKVTIAAIASDSGSGIAEKKFAKGDVDFENEGTAIDSYLFEVTESGTYYVWVKDNAGNTTTKTIEIDNINHEIPTIELTQDPLQPTKGSITVTASFSKPEDKLLVKKWAQGVKPVSFFRNAGELLNDANQFTATTSDTYTVYVKDIYGNEETKTIVISNIDNISPVVDLKVVDKDPINHNATIEVNTMETGTGVVETRWAAGTYTVETFPSSLSTDLEGTTFVVTANGTYTVYVKDAAGNETVKTIEITNIDKDVPIITLTPSETAPTTQDVVVTASFNKEPSKLKVKKWAKGAQNTAYFATQGTELSVDNRFTAEENGTYTVYVKDAAGNEITETIVITNIDKTTPVIQLAIAERDPINHQAVIGVQIMETGSGVVEKKWAKGNYTVATFGIAASTDLTDSLFTVGENGFYTVYVKDEAGNETVQTIEVTNIDQDVPVITLSPSETAPTKQNISVAADISKEVSVKKWAKGAQNTAYFATQGTELSADNRFTAEENGTYTVYVKDAAGNEITETIVITNIDKEAPQISYEPPNGWINTELLITPLISDSGTGIARTKWAEGSKDESYFTTDGTSFTGSFAIQQNGQYTIYAEDAAGNQSVHTFIVENVIDSTLPTLTVNVDNNSTNDKVRITVDGSDSESGREVIKWLKGIRGSSDFKETGQIVEGGFFEVTENGDYSVYIRDNAGNEVVKTVEVSSIDNDLPLITVDLPREWTNQDVTISAEVAKKGSPIVTTQWAMGEQDKAYFRDGNGTELTPYGVDAAVTRNIGQTAIDEQNFEEATQQDSQAEALVAENTSENSDTEQPAEDVSQEPTAEAPVTENTPENPDTEQPAEDVPQDPTAEAPVEENTPENPDTEQPAEDVPQEPTAEAPVEENTPEDPATEQPVEVVPEDPAAEAPQEPVVEEPVIGELPQVPEVIIEPLPEVIIPAPLPEIVPAFTTSDVIQLNYQFTIQENGAYTIYARDEAGNEQISLVTVGNIDKTAPVINAKIVDHDSLNFESTIAVEIIENGSGIREKKWARGLLTANDFATTGEELVDPTFNVHENGTYTVYVKDNAGNESVKYVTVEAITLPNIHVELVPLTDNGSKVSVSIDNLSSPIVEKKWLKGVKDVSDFASAGNAFAGNDFTVTEEGMYTVYIKDLSGNEVVKTFVYQNNPYQIEGTLSNKEGIKATATISLRDGTNPTSGTKYIVFQLMKGTTPVRVVAIEKSLQTTEIVSAYFNITGPDYSVIVNVLDKEVSSQTDVGRSLAASKTLTIQQ